MLGIHILLMVAGGGIEPPTRGFSVCRRSHKAGSEMPSASTTRSSASSSMAGRSLPRPSSSDAAPRRPGCGFRTPRCTSRSFQAVPAARRCDAGTRSSGRRTPGKFRRACCCQNAAARQGQSPVTKRQRRDRAASGASYRAIPARRYPRAHAPGCNPARATPARCAACRNRTRR